MLKNTILKTLLDNKSLKCQIIRESSYRVLVIPGHTKVEEVKRIARRTKPKVKDPRYKSMGDGDSWVDVWPAAKTFNHSILPLPVRMGYIEKTENDGIIPGKYANAELMKIPNFLHLTPQHIKKHCLKLKNLCTPWPQGVEQKGMMVLNHFDYVRDGPSVKDERSRFVSVMVRLSNLHFPAASKEKFLRLTSRFCVRQDDLLIITSGKCPTKQQNFDYIHFLLSVLYKESMKLEDWEGGKEVEDMVQYQWELNKSHGNVMQLLKLMEEGSGRVGGIKVTQKDGEVNDEEVVAIESEITDDIRKDVEAKEKVKKGGLKTMSGEVGDGEKGGGGTIDGAVVGMYGRSVERLLNQKENMALVQQYKSSVQSLYSSILNK